ncbi:stalk domain-containing protein [Kyrpidia spormannii]|uniref:Uncharacterized protein n=1 Tax=Kyrpidia spormannii TaxID=2055160 RepID=A0ACA8ZDC7_9BACL|nr:TolC family protein [Kyrpidia spormannii]CAB3395524.1 conserved exported protein of unknown function [Kyrpidia spormannii]
MRWKPLAVLTLAAIVGGSVPALAADTNSNPVQVIVNGGVAQWTSAPKVVDGNILLPIDEFAGQFQAVMKQYNDGQNASLSKDSHVVMLTAGSNVAQLNGKQITLPIAPLVLNGKMYVPADPIAKWLGGDVEWVAATDTLYLATQGTLRLGTGGSNDSGVDMPLSYERAVELAYSNSYRVKNALADIDRSRDVLNKAGENVKYLPTGPGADPAVNKAFTGYTQASIAYGMSQKAYGMAQDVVAYAVKQAYNGILQAQAQQQAAQAALKNAQVQANIATVGHQYGTVSDIQWQQAVQALQAAQATAQAADKAVADAYQRLNSLTGLPADAKYQVVDQPQVTDLKGVDPETQVSRVISDSPSIWQAEQQVNLAKLQLDLYTFNDPNNPDPYEAKQIDVQKAYNSEADLKDQLAQAVRSSYNSLQELAAQYQSLQSQLAAAEQSLKLAQIQYQYGTGIQADVVAAQAKVDQLKQQLANTAAQFDNLKMVFEKPWVAGGSGGSGGGSGGGGGAGGSGGAGA